MAQLKGAAGEEQRLSVGIPLRVRVRVRVRVRASAWSGLGVGEAEADLGFLSLLCQPRQLCLGLELAHPAALRRMHPVELLELRLCISKLLSELHAADRIRLPGRWAESESEGVSDKAGART